MGRGSGALAVYLSLYQHVPYDRLAEIFADVLGIPVSVGAIASWLARPAGRSGSSSRSSPTCWRCDSGALG